MSGRLGHSTICHHGASLPKEQGNISGANKSLRANRANFNLGHRINIQGVWGVGNFTINRPPVITLLQIPLPPSLHTPLDFDPVAQIEVCTVCTERLVCT